MRPITILLLFLLPGLGADRARADLVDDVPILQERWVSALDPALNIDSLASYHGPAGEHWLFATAKSGHFLRLMDAVTGETLRDLGGAGDAAGLMTRPNGVAVIDDLLVVVERDNRRVQVWQLPGLEPLGTFGDEVLRKPYGLYLYRLDDGFYRIFVTDNYEAPEGERLAPVELDKRVHEWRLALPAAKQGRPALSAQYEGAFGETDGPGMLWVVESLYGDPAYDRLLIAEEDEAFRDDTRVVKVYSLEGRYTGPLIGAGDFIGQPEGIALRACADGTGQWLMADQGKDRNLFHVFDRQTFRHLGVFRGAVTLNTDGVWFSGAAMPGYPGGAFFAVHDDQGAVAFGWDEIAVLLGFAPGPC
jgi:3-phytase